ncbi:hypothetical protein SAMD00023353_12400070 [Rosellinia necatrix]|uniref:Uncharacterized protein n=1 Tax=Rosellinia necatrix TaxID=77044 RepID=A0A1W2TXK3_ROSNE|nr:hypothetical protein SAMD00023353_12400070 [Rosellinia necatrix]
MACITCKLSLDDHHSALRVLGELPFGIAKSVLRHQWHKDITRIIYAHAEHLHDERMSGCPPTHRQQLSYLDTDIKRHRAEYITCYLHAVIEVNRHEEVGATLVTREHEILICRKLEEALNYDLPNDLDAVFRGPKPYAWKGVMTWEQSKYYQDDVQNSIETEDHTLGQHCMQQVVDSRLITVIPTTVRPSGCDGFPMFIPKTPDPMWCWNQTTEHIREYQHMTKPDLF